MSISVVAIFTASLQVCGVSASGPAMLHGPGMDEKGQGRRDAPKSRATEVPA